MADIHRPRVTSSPTGAGRRRALPAPTWIRLSVIIGIALTLSVFVSIVASRSRWRGAFFGTHAPKNVLLVSIDTLRADHVGCYGYREALTPHLDGVAASGLRLEQASTSVPLTLPAHSSLMTGTFPAWHGVRDNGGFYLAQDQ